MADPKEPEHILLVEDDPGVRTMVGSMLKALGYQVSEAADAAGALVLFRSGVVFDMMLTDIVMPGGMDGWDLAQQVRREQPDFPVLYMTGYTDHAAMSRAIGVQGPVTVLSKPFRRRDLADAVRNCLEPASPPEAGSNG